MPPFDREYTPCLALRYRVVAQADFDQTQRMLDRARRAKNLAETWGFDFRLLGGSDGYELEAYGDDCDRTLAALIAADAAPTEIIGDRILERYSSAETPLSERIRATAKAAGIRYVDLNN